uniref:Uncharacterized protein n=1 Tax=Romanomermis culicivorax TaxID=13658 RepID=A0A915L4C5_ROMCU
MARFPTCGLATTSILWAECCMLTSLRVEAIGGAVVQSPMLKGFLGGARAVPLLANVRGLPRPKILANQ